MAGRESALATTVDALSEVPGGPSPSAGKTLYVGNLHPFVTEPVLQDIFATLGQVKEVKIIKDKVTGLSAGYGFVEYVDPRCAELALNSIHGRVLYGQEVRVNWAFQKDSREDTSHHFHIFVGDLSSEINDRTLYEAFARCPNCSDARVMWDHGTGRSKGYGFVSYRTKEDAEHGIRTMNGEQVGTRRVRCGWAQHKQDDTLPMDQKTVDLADPSNTNVYVGNISPQLSDQDLRRAFAAFGQVLEVKTYRKAGYGFVRFASHLDAVRSIVAMNGATLHDRQLKCSWGRFQNGHKGNTALAESQQMFLAAAMGPQLMQARLVAPNVALAPTVTPLVLTPSQLTAGGVVANQGQGGSVSGGQRQQQGSQLLMDAQGMYYGVHQVYYQ